MSQVKGNGRKFHVYGINRNEVGYVGSYSDKEMAEHGIRTIVGECEVSEPRNIVPSLTNFLNDMFDLEPPYVRVYVPKRRLFEVKAFDRMILVQA